ncbi:isochorismate synthase [Endozoicomonas sp. 8E]|uniref:isochorismate synthase n=1 Tax=Endozoicomonas sp. 8E TaxID=3035692 RepID=UPI0029390F3A|nr:isochorismate synthase [Endozoicomonas sp. 8E]WOG26326.1 isochorismate synthase [Endozoicomonas sp. 8E]
MLIEEVRSQVAELTERLRQLRLSGAPEQTLVRIEQPLPMINLFNWLSGQTLPGKSYWQDRESDYKAAGLGKAWRFKVKDQSEVNTCFQQVNAMLDKTTRCLGYLSFSDSQKMIWPEFGYGEFFFPVIEVVQTRKGCSLACHLLGHDELSWGTSLEKALDYLAQVSWTLEEVDSHYLLGAPEFLPDQAHWTSLIGHALEGFESGALQKVVLSREAQLSLLEGQLNPWMLLYHWQLANPRSYVFAFESDQGSLFFGCSPERLFRRVDRVVQTEALAGTTRRGSSRHEDFKLELRLLNDSKNVHENRLVLDDIRRRLESICCDLEFDRSHSVVKLKTIQHLRQVIRGVLKDEVSDSQLLSLLHPTPAVGGEPREMARHFIEEREVYSRGLYAGACGVLGKKRSEFTVSIRSALLEERQLRAFSGAGIVNGSDAQDEWQELNNKIGTLLSLLDPEAPVMDASNRTGRSYDLSHQTS